MARKSAELWACLKEQRFPPWAWCEERQEFDDQTCLRELILQSGLKPTHSFHKLHGVHLGHSRFGRWKHLLGPNGDPEQTGYVRDLMPMLASDDFRNLVAHPDVQKDINDIIEAWKDSPASAFPTGPTPARS